MRVYTGTAILERICQSLVKQNVYFSDPVGPLLGINPREVIPQVHNCAYIIMLPMTLFRVTGSWRQIVLITKRMNILCVGSACWGILCSNKLKSKNKSLKYIKSQKKNYNTMITQFHWCKKKKISNAFTKPLYKNIYCSTCWNGSHILEWFHNKLENS